MRRRGKAPTSACERRARARSAGAWGGGSQTCVLQAYAPLLLLWKLLYDVRPVEAVIGGAPDPVLYWASYNYTHAEVRTVEAQCRAVAIAHKRPADNQMLHVPAAGRASTPNQGRLCLM
jgi:hypothetical protein